ncbi:MFS transporter [Kitasatospora kifunensis]|uniref:Uncharacterized protein n=1 Tax=Kitasatospora kifunensis TaxID=58351 RepID=A0A7W7R556_KITKI|nr:MFS transporter [Kitasatospora kifunensis]MBB4925554.1 hypothetical protein [Kitasatospora kifunensis]
MAVSDRETAAPQPVPGTEPPGTGPAEADLLVTDDLPPWAEPDRFARTPAQRAAMAGTLTVLGVVAAILLGSRGLRDFDATLIPYAVATVFLAFGLAYRCALWLSEHPAQRGRSTLSWRRLRTAPVTLPRLALARLGLKGPPGARSPARRTAQQLLFWGCLLAAVITIPLTWGWLTCTAADPAGSGYQLRLWGFRLLGFDADGFLGWSLFHGLDLAAVLVIAGAGYLLWRRPRDQEAAGQTGLGSDFLPLIALVAIAVTGLLLTFSALALHGGGYQFLAVLHMASVVLTLVFLPFGAFSRLAPRPPWVGLRFAELADLGVGAAGHRRGAAFACRRCGEAIGTTESGTTQSGTPRSGTARADATRSGPTRSGTASPAEARRAVLRFGFDRWAAYCGRCQRLLRGDAYLSQPQREAR